MTHLYTRGSEYAVRALQAMVRSSSETMSVSELCDVADIPEAFTRKMLQQLVHAGILLSARGPGGGVSFARDPEAITLGEVIQVIDQGARTDRCILGRRKCSDDNPCALHHDWQPIKLAANQLLAKRTVGSLRPSSQKKRGRRT